MSALNEQVGGDHYKKQGLQPFEITYQNFGYFGLKASVFTKVNKYLTRDKAGSDHRENIEKAIHSLQCQLEFLDRHEAETASNAIDKWILREGQPILNSTGK